MFALPAICERCGAVFSTAGNIELGPGVSNATLAGNVVGPCPACGIGMGRIPDGTYDTVHGTLRMLLKDPVSADMLRTLARILQASWEVGADQAAVAERIEAEAPELREFASSLRNLKLDWKFWLPFLVAILSLLAQLQIIGPRPEQVSDEQIERAVRRAVEQPTPTSQQPTASTIGKTGRNSPCPCGSGMKYKRCHGRNAPSHGPSEPPGIPGP